MRRGIVLDTSTHTQTMNDRRIVNAQRGAVLNGLAAYAYNNRDQLYNLANRASTYMRSAMSRRSARVQTARANTSRTAGQWTPGRGLLRRRRRRVPPSVRRAKRVFTKRVKKVLLENSEPQSLRVRGGVANQTHAVDELMYNGCALYAPVINPQTLNLINYQGGSGLSSGNATAKGFIGVRAKFTAYHIHIRCTIPQPLAPSEGLNWWVGYKIIKATRKGVAENEIAIPDTTLPAAMQMGVFGERSLTATTPVIGFPDPDNSSYKLNNPRSFCHRWPAFGQPVGPSNYQDIFGVTTTGSVNPWMGTWNKANYTILKEGLLCTPRDPKENAREIPRTSGYAKVTLPINKEINVDLDAMGATNAWDYFFPDTYLLVWCWNPSYPTPTAPVYQSAADTPDPALAPLLNTESYLYWRSD